MLTVHGKMGFGQGSRVSEEGRPLLVSAFEAAESVIENIEFHFTSGVQLETIC